MIPKISLVAFEERDLPFIFVAVPNQRGRYLRTDKSVALVGCGQCGAHVGEPCRSRHGDGYVGTTHFVRRNEAQSSGFRGTVVGDVVDTNEQELYRLRSENQQMKATLDSITRMASANIINAN